ncbi:MAG TPA: hypothetical protein VGQ00_04370 [Candidatus Norongarragalinales archaeon]|jgi:hypothetical protein|nr:hypothetical protein [Candidatus Norongarragalinales archaeon]
MGIFELFGKKAETNSDSIYSLSTDFHPFRLPAYRNDSVDLEITVRNNTDTELLTSVVVVVPKPLGFDSTALSQQREVRIGMLAGGDQRSMKIQIYGNGRTDPRSYPVKVFAISHYRDYGHVLNEVRKILELRAA